MGDRGFPSEGLFQEEEGLCDADRSCAFSAWGLPSLRGWRREREVQFLFPGQDQLTLGGGRGGRQRHLSQGCSAWRDSPVPGAKNAICGTE